MKHPLKKLHLGSRFCWFIASVLLLAGIGSYYSPKLTNYEATSYHPRVTRSMIAKTAHKRVLYGSHADAKPVGLSDMTKARRDPNVKVIGQMIAPHLHLPIDAGDGTDSLLLGAGTMSSQQKMGRGNYSLASHHMRNRDALFSPVYDYARRGSKVWLTDDTNVYEYVIDNRKTVDEDDVGVLNPTKQPRLTLITCLKTLGGRQRVIISGHLVAKMGYQQSPKSVQYQFNQPCNNHNVFAGY